MSDDLGIKLSVEFDSYDKVNGKLQSLITQLQKNSTFSFKLDDSLITKQIITLQDKLNDTSLDIGVSQNTIKNIGNVEQSFAKLKKQMQDLYGSQGFVDVTAKGVDGIEKFTVSIKKANGEIEKLKFALNKETLKFDLFDVENIDKTSELYEKQIQKIQEVNKKISDEQQKLADAMANGRERSNTSSFQKLQAEEKAKASSINASLEKEYNKKIQNEKRADEIIYKTRKDLMTRLELLQNKYGNLADDNQINKLKNSLSNLSNTNLDNLKKDIIDVNNEYKKLLEETRNKGVRNQDSRSIFDSLKHDFVKFSEFYLVGGLVTGVKDAFVGTVMNITEMDTALTDLSKVVDISKSKLNDMRLSAIDLGKDLAQSSTEIVKGYAEFGRVFKDLSSIQELTRVSTMASNVTDLSIQDSSKAINSTLLNFKLNAHEAMTILDQWNEINYCLLT